MKEIYRLLKRDVSKVNTSDSINKQSFIQKTFTEASNNQENGFSSESSDSDDSCCEGGGNGNDDGDNEKGGDDLTPSELEELQNDIIKALENFDMLYNNNKKKGGAATAAGPKSLDRGNMAKRGTAIDANN